MKTINIKGDIISNDYAWIYDWMEWDYTSPRQVEKELAKANGDEVLILINSGGGSVFDGYEIFNLIKGYNGKTIAKIVGLAASAASFIAMAADKVQASALSQIMIHRATNGNQGNAPSHHDNANFLEQVDNTIVKAYTMRNGKDENEMLELMNKTTWFTAEEALENGIVDEIVNDKCIKPMAFNALDGEKHEMINKLIELGSVENIKKALLENKCLGQKVVNSAIDNTNKGGNTMELEDFMEKEPALYNQIVENAQKEAVTNERARIASINALAKPGTEAQIKDGIEKGLNAGEVAINILNAQTALNNAQLENMEKDAENSGLANVDTSNAPQQTEATDKEQSVNLLVNAGKKIMGGRR